MKRLIDKYRNWANLFLKAVFKHAVILILSLLIGWILITPFLSYKGIFINYFIGAMIPTLFNLGKDYEKYCRS